VADQMKTQFALRSFDAAVGLADLGPETAQLGLGIDDWSDGNIVKRAVENFHRFVHFEQADHVAIEGVAVIAERNAKIESVINAVFIDLANVVIDAARAEHGAGDRGVDGEIGRQYADALRAGEENFIFREQRFKLVKKGGITIDDL